MVEETIRTIRETENQADEIVKAAQERRRVILEEAQAEAQRQREEILGRALQSARKTEESARQKSLLAEQEAGKALESYVEELKGSVREKETEAAEKILSRLI